MKMTRNRVSSGIFEQVLLSVFASNSKRERERVCVLGEKEEKGLKGASAPGPKKKAKWTRGRIRPVCGLVCGRHAQEERSECGQFGYASESSGGFIINRERTCSEIAAEDSEEEEQEEE